MNSNSSSYYPPRAQDRWLPRNFTRRIDRMGVGLRRLFARSPLGTPMVLSLTGAEFLLCLLLPGDAYRRLGQKALGLAFLLGWVGCGLCVPVFLGHPLILGWAVGGMASCHASGLGYLFLRERETSRGYPDGLGGKIMVPLVTWFLYAACIYWPGFLLFQNTVARPLFLPAENRAVIFSSLARPAAVARDDLVAYQAEGFRLRGPATLPVVFPGGLMLGRVIGRPGDQIEFGPRLIRVNGRYGDRLPTMPVSGEVRVRPGEWLIWPTVNLRVVNAGMDPGGIAEAYLRLARVPQSNFVGRAFHRWFFQRQDLP